MSATVADHLEDHRTDEQQRWFRGDIDGLRAIAIILVVAYHAHLPLFRGGFIGVDVFFVISGFLISRNLLREAETRQRIGLATFWARRVRRLVPALALVVTVTLIAGYLVMPSFELDTFGQQGAAAVLYLSNMLFAVQAQDYFATDVSSSPFLHTWSLGVEEQFYLVWPLLFAGACWWGMRFVSDHRPLARRRLLTIAFAVTFALSFALNVALARDGSTWAFFGLPARAWEFAAAGLLAAVPVPRVLRTVGARTVLAVGGLLLLAFATAVISDAVIYPGLWALLPVTATVLVIIAGETWAGGVDATPVSRALSAGPMQWMGRVSYSWYLWHWPAIVLVVIAVGEDTVALRTAAAVATLPLAYLVYRYFETPLRFAPIFSRSNARTFAFAAVTTAVVVAGSFAVRPEAVAGDAAGRTLDQRVDDVVQRYKARSQNPCTKQSLKTDEGDGYCALGDPNGTRSVLLLGDSHAGQWRSVLDQLAWERGVTLYIRSHRCPTYPVDVIDPKAGQPEIDDCRSAQKGDVRVIDALDPDAVILASWAGYGELMVDPDGNKLPPEAIGPAWEAAAERFLTDIADRGIALGVILDEPTLPVNSSLCIVAEQSIEACEVTREEAVATAGSASEAERRVVDRIGGVATVDMIAAVCDVDRCHLEIGDKLVYVDTNHLSDEFIETQTPLISGLLDQLVGR